MGVADTEASLRALRAEAKPPRKRAVPDDLERVREMLFGEEQRRQEERIEALERDHRGKIEAIQSVHAAQIERLKEALVATIEAADERWTHRVNAIERSLGVQLNELHERLAVEQAERRELERQVSEMKNELGETGSELRDAQRSYEEEVRTQLLSQGELLSKSIHRRHDEAMNAIAESAAELRRSKADRDTIAELFLGVAERLTIEP